MKLSALVSLVIVGVLIASPVKSQIVESRGAAHMPCPTPTPELLQMINPVVVNADFPPIALAAPAGINDPATDKYFLHSFIWHPRACCQITSASLTVVMTANFPGYLANAGTGNDTIGIYANGSAIPGMGGAFYTVPFPINYQTTKTITINAAGLAFMNANHRLSFLVQDDTRVLSATLHISRCCVNVN